MRNKLGKNYKWLVLTGCALVLMCYFGVVNNLYSIYIIPVCDDLGFSRSAYTLIQSIYYASVVVMSFFAARIFERFGVLKSLKFSCITIMVFYCLNGFVSSLPLFYAIGIINGLMMGLNCVVPTTFLIKQWFSDNVGFAIGIAQAMSGIGGLIFNQIAKKILLISSWRVLYISMGLLMGIMGIFATFVLIKENTDNVQNLDSETPKSSDSLPVKWSITVPIMLCLGLLTFSHNAVMYTAAPYVQDIGYDLVYAANVSSLLMGAFGIGKMLFGLLTDRFGIIVMCVISGLCICIGNAGMLLFPRFGGMMLIPMCLSVGLGSPFATVGVSVLPEISAKGFQKRATSLYVAGVNLGTSTLPIVSSLIFDNIGTYHPLYMISIAASALQLIVLTAVVYKSSKVA